MDILLKDVVVIDPTSPFHQQTVSLFIQNGIIAEIGNLEHKADEVIALPQLHISTGWVDTFAHFCDPGFEYRETLESGSEAAAAGGFTDVLLVPNTLPVVHHKTGVDYIVRNRAAFTVNLHPIGALTKNTEGKELAEMYDMTANGALAFSDGLCPLQSAGVLLKALQYVKAVNKTVIQLPVDASLAATGLMNEGVVSTQLGLPGVPALAEEILINRDIELARYASSKIHFTGVSTAKGLSLIKKAKEEGLLVSCSVTPYHLYYTDADLETYDTNLKLTPPLRSSSDREALRAGVLDGTVDCIATHHLPQHSDAKMVEFEYAKPGMIGLETCFAVVRSCMPELPLARLISLLTEAPRRIFELPTGSINVNQPASLSLFLPEEKWTPLEYLSRSRNTPFTGKALTGKPMGIINKDKLFLRP